MGKALVIDGLSVTNPLCRVTFAQSDLERIVNPYYTLNSSINSSEKNALETFVQGILDNNLWSKFKYFYPLLGDNLSDMYIDLVSPSTEDIVSGSPKTGLSVSNRVLVANGRSLAEGSLSSRATSIDTKNLGIILSGKADSWNGTGQGFGFRATSASSGAYIKLETHASSSANGYEYFINGTSTFKNEASTSVLESISFGNTVNSHASVYRDTTLKAEADVTPPTWSYNKSYGVFFNAQSSDYKWNFGAVTEGMTSNDWLIVYPLLLNYLKAVGKHS